MVSKIVQLEERLQHVEDELARLKADQRQSKSINGQSPWWEQIIGDYADDDDFDEIIRLGAEWRKQQQEP